MDLVASIAVVASGLVMSGPMIIPWLQRQGVVKTSNRTEQGALQTMKETLEAQVKLTNEQIEIAKAAQTQAELYRKERIGLETKLDKAYADQREERSQAYATFQAEKAADRLQIESLSKNVHELTIKVMSLTAENEALKREVHALSAKIGDGHANSSSP